MNFANAFRVVVILACFMNVGLMVALFERIGRYFVPRLWMRSLFVADGLIMIGLGVGFYHRLGQPVTLRHGLVAVGAVLQLVAFIGLWVWYGTPAGQEHAARMLATAEILDGPLEAHVETATERRVRHLAVGGLGLFAVLLSSLLVFSWFTWRTHDALCSFRAGLQDQADGTQAYLDAHPELQEIAGVTRASIQTNLDSQHRRLRDLRGLRC